MKAHAIFRLGRDAELRRTTNGESVLDLALATNVRKGKEEVAVWVSASLWGKRGESLHSFLVKGTQIMADLDGLHMETYEGKNGPGTKLVARVIDITLLGSRQDSQGPSATPYTTPRPAASPAPAPRASNGFDDDDDEPF